MSLIWDYFSELYQATIEGWNRFWFSSQDPATLCAIRVLAGSMLLYTHLVWGVDMMEMWGEQGKLSAEFSHAFLGNTIYGWSHLYYFDHHPLALQSVHFVGLVILLAFMLGWWTRLTSILAFLLTVSYSHRGVGALYGLDQINSMLALYLMIGPSGAMYSLDAWWGRGGESGAAAQPSIGANIAIRMIQIHMCLIYLFAALGKLLGNTWWDGTALWGAFANYEYQTIDMAWMSHYEVVVNLLTHITIVWELTYPVLVWPRLTRPLVIFGAVPLHLGIAVCMGMMTFGLMMLYGNMAFVSPALTRQVVAGLARPAWRGQGRSPLVSRGSL